MHLGGGVAHGDHTVRHVGEVEVESLGLEAPLLLTDNLPDGGRRHVARGNVFLDSINIILTVHADCR